MLPFRSAPILFAAALAILGAAAPARAAEEDANLWFGQFATLNASETVLVRLEAQERFTDDAGRLGQVLLRGLVGYRIDKGAHVGAGYAFIRTDPVGPVRRNEHRFYQELSLRLLETEGGTTIDARTRLEQRSFEDRAGTGWRLRQFVQLRTPIGPHNKLVLSSEPFIELDEAAGQRGGLSIWRNFAGVGVPLSKNAELVPGYLNQYVVRAGPDRIDHTANLNLFVSF